MKFWEEPQTEADHARAAEAGRAATERQMRDDVNATRRMLAMQERPWCRDCGKRRATKVHNGVLKCDVCDPAVIWAPEPIEGSKRDRNARRTSLCAFCGNPFEMTPDRQRYCSPDCFQQSRGSAPKRTPKRKPPTPGLRQIRTIPIDGQRVYNADSSGALPNELERHKLAG